MNFVYSKQELIVSGMAVGIVVTLLAVGFGIASGRPASTSEEAFSDDLRSSFEIALEILDEAPIIDGHNDFPWSLRTLVQNDLSKVDFNSRISAQEPWKSFESDHTDLVRMRQGRVGGQFWSAYVGCDTQNKDATAKFLEQIDVIHQLVAAYPDQLMEATSAADIEEAFSQKKIASLIGVESGHAIDNKLGVLRMLYDLGTRYMTLTHSCNTPWADSSISEDEGNYPRSSGLSSFGRRVVREMNRLGMMVDLSHVSADTMRDALATTYAPVIFSHSSARNVTDHSRNVPDDVLARMRLNRGIVMVNVYNCFIKQDCVNATIDDVVRHLNHIRDVAGVDHVGIGADFNGVEGMPIGMEDVSKYPNLFAKLIDDGWRAEDLKKLSSGNLIRVFKEVERVRDALKEKNLDPSWIPEKDLKYEDLECHSVN